jgi:phospholipase C
MNRRQFNRTAFMAAGAALLGEAALRVGSPRRALAQSLPSLPDPNSSGIEHIVAITMENRSFDHFLGWLPNADGRQGGLTYLDPNGVPHATHSLSGNYTGCPAADPDHSYAGGRIEYNGGAMNGFLLDPANDAYCIGYYGSRDIPFYAALARNYTTCDRYFASILGPTFPNRMFIHSAQTDRLSNTLTFTSMPTIWDRLAAANVSHAYYFNNIPFLALWGLKYAGISKTFDQFLVDAASDTLPSVSFLDPRFTILDDGTGNDDEPHADIRRGDRFLYDVFNAVSKSPGWSSTILIVNFDEWGGFFEHVPPPRAQAANTVDPDMVGGKTLLGMRVPVVVASPWSAGDPANPSVSSLTFDHTSVLKLIEWRWGLSPLTPRDGSNDVNNLAYALDFDHPQTAVPALPKPRSPLFVPPCFTGLFGGALGSELPSPAGRTSSAKTLGATNARNSTAWKSLRDVAHRNGFKVE